MPLQPTITYTLVTYLDRNTKRRETLMADRCAYTDGYHYLGLYNHGIALYYIPAREVVSIIRTTIQPQQLRYPEDLAGPAAEPPVPA
jgi:hypothetical protein